MMFAALVLYTSSALVLSVPLPTSFASRPFHLTFMLHALSHPGLSALDDRLAEKSGHFFDSA